MRLSSFFISKIMSQHSSAGMVNLDQGSTIIRFQNDGGKRVPATMAVILDAVRWAEEIMREIDSRWPIEPNWNLQ